MTVNQAPTSVPEYAMMQADPLNAPPVGKPDYNAVATNTTRFRDVYDVTTTAAGQAAFHFNAAASTNSVSPTITAGAVTSWGTATPSGYQASIEADNSTCRVLCQVVEWQPTLSVNNASGKVFIGQYIASPVTFFPPTQALNAYFDDEGVIAPATHPATVINRPLGELPWRKPTDSEPHTSFASVVVILTGMPAVAQIVGQIVVTRIVELQPAGTTLARFQATHTVCDMTDCCVAANLVGNSVTRAAGENAYDKLVAAGTKLVRMAMRLYSAYSTSGASELRRMLK